MTRSQAVARIADRTASQQTLVPNLRCTADETPCSQLDKFPVTLSLTVSEILNVICNATVDVTLIRPLNKGQGHSFWYQSISHI